MASSTPTSNNPSSMASSSGTQNNPSSTGTENNQGMTRDAIAKYFPLVNAAMKGDWESAESFLQLNPEGIRSKITPTGNTALMTAAVHGQTLFVEKLLNSMTDEAVLMQGENGNTALTYAALSGTTQTAKILVQNNRNLLSIRNDNGHVPLIIAATFDHKDMVRYLYSEMGDGDTSLDRTHDGFLFLAVAVRNELYDVALHVLKRYPLLGAGQANDGRMALRALAQKPSSFESASRVGFWQRIVYPYVHVEPFDTPRPFNNGHVASPLEMLHYLNQLLWTTLKLVPGIKEVHNSKFKHKQAHELVKLLLNDVLLPEELKVKMASWATPALISASELGISEIVTEAIRSYPILIWTPDAYGRTIFHLSVQFRHEKIFKLIHGIGAAKHHLISSMDTFGNTILHLAAGLAPPRELKSVSGAALQMQRELQWFKEVERIVQPGFKEIKNKVGLTPQDVFTKEHAELVKEGEKWMKDTATSCMLVATLIATVMFASAFAVPGGYNNDEGSPIFLHATSFLIFAISDILALFCSTISILMFLSILTSSYAEIDFLKSLPNRLIYGLATLFLSIVAMMVCFSATTVIILDRLWTWVAIPISLLACVPIISFVLVQFPLLVNMLNSTYGSGIFHS